ncbi:MAG: serine/threonine-protein kinase, partial [Anaerolineales bacterium]
MPDLIGKAVGCYTVLEQIGRGGMATVYKALNRNDGQTVAIKVLTPQLAMEENFRARFRREARVLRKFKHPNIVPVLDYGEANGLVYLVMPFMQVGTLRDRMLSGELRVQEAASIVNQIASALQYAHDARVIHRDVKPSNILIDENGNAWLSDFGFAHVSDSSLSLTGSALIGTPAYISPEQINGSKITHLSDQYSLGVLLYHLSTGRLPYDADTPIAIAIKHATEPLPRPRSVNPNLPDAVEAILIKALAKDPAQRFNSVAEFNDAFQAALQQALDPVSGLLKPGAVGTAPLSPHIDTAP